MLLAGVAEAALGVGYGVGTAVGTVVGGGAWLLGGLWLMLRG